MSFSKWIFWIGLFSTCAAWPHLTTTLAGSIGLLQGYLQPRTWSTPHTASVAILATDETPTKSLATEVKHLISVSYNGLNYIMVKNVSLDFAEAERYCLEEFSDPMHLASVQSEEEWKMLTKHFGTRYPSEIWLGGSVRRTTSRLFVLSWIDGLKFAYNRFPSTERKRWQSNWRLNSQGCIVANMQIDGLGSWTAELTPCSESRGFVCKESARPLHQQQETVQMHSMLMPQQLVDFSTLIRSVLTQPPFFRRLIPPEFAHSDWSNRYAESSGPQKQAKIIGHAEHVPTSTSTVKPPISVPQLDSMTTATTMAPAEEDVEQTPGVTTQSTRTMPNPLESETNETESSSKPTTTVATQISQPVPNKPKKLGITVFPVSERAELRTHRSSTATKTTKPVPKIAAQVIYPKTIWDLTYPEEPKWLSEKVA